MAGMGQFAEAVACYDQALLKDRTFFMAYLNKGLAKIELGHNEIGIACLNKALMLNPNLAPAYNNKVTSRCLV